VVTRQGRRVAAAGLICAGSLVFAGRAQGDTQFCGLPATPAVAGDVDAVLRQPNGPAGWVVTDHANLGPRTCVFGHIARSVTGISALGGPVELDEVATGDGTRLLVRPPTTAAPTPKYATAVVDEAVKLRTATRLSSTALESLQPGRRFIVTCQLEGNPYTGRDGRTSTAWGRIPGKTVRYVALDFVHWYHGVAPALCPPAWKAS
jgi:hypothetical protein